VLRAAPVPMHAVCEPRPCRALRGASSVPLPCESTTYSPFLFPAGATHRNPIRAPCEMPGELGVTGAWLPVVHQLDIGTTGLWMYYARGCSDMLWNVGRTLIARNRCHAAMLLAKMSHNITDQAAAARAAKHLQLDDVQHVRSRAMGWMHASPNVTSAELLADCARGLFGNCTGGMWDEDGRLQMCTCAAGRQGSERWNETHPVGSWQVQGRKRSMTLSLLAGSAGLDEALKTLMLRLPRRLRLDTLQLWQQPQGGGSLLWATELMDVRHAGLFPKGARERAIAADPELLARRARRLVGGLNVAGTASTTAACLPSRGFERCLACANSTLEVICDDNITLAQMAPDNMNESFIVEQLWGLARAGNERPLLRTSHARLQRVMALHGLASGEKADPKSKAARVKLLLRAARTENGLSVTSPHRYLMETGVERVGAPHSTASPRRNS